MFLTTKLVARARYTHSMIESVNNQSRKAYVSAVTGNNDKAIVINTDLAFDMLSNVNMYVVITESLKKS